MEGLRVERRRPEDDLAAISRLLHEAHHADEHAPLAEHKWLDLVHDGRSGSSGFVARDERDRIVGYAHLSRRESSWAIEIVVHPDRRSPEEGIRAGLVRAALAEIRENGGGDVHVWVSKPGVEDDALAEAYGLHPGRELLQMRRPLPVEGPPPELTVRAFRPGVDETAWLEVNNRAFKAHPEQGAWGLETLQRREREHWFDPEGFLLYEEDGVLVGSCWTKVHDQEPALGEIYVVSVDPSRQGRGLGRELTLCGLHHLATQGIPIGMLYVDAANVAAVSLYRKLGFTVDHVDRAYAGGVQAA